MAPAGRGRNNLVDLSNVLNGPRGRRVSAAQPAGRRMVPTNLAQSIVDRVSSLLTKNQPPKNQRGSGQRRRRRPNQFLANSMVRSIPTQVLAREDRFLRGMPTSVAFAPRGQGHYDAFARRPEAMVVGSQVGPVTLVEGYAHTVVRGRVPIDNLAYDLFSQTALQEPNPGDNIGVYKTANFTGNPVIIVFNPGASTAHLGSIYSLVKINTPVGVRASVKVEEIQATALQGFGGGSHDYQEVQGPGSGDAQPLYMEGASLAPGNTLPYGTAGVTGAVESIPLRGSIRIRNITEHRNVGGDVRIMRYNGGLNLAGVIRNSFGSFVGPDGKYSTSSYVFDVSENHPLDGTQSWDANTLNLQYGVRGLTMETFLEIVEMMRDSSRSLPLSGHDLVKSHQSNTYPADFVRSHTFRFDDTFIEAAATPKYNSVVILIDDFSPSTGEGAALPPNNTYSVTCQVQRACRFKPGTQMHNKAVTLRADSDRHSKASFAESVASYASPVIDGLRDGIKTGMSKLAYDKFASFDLATAGELIAGIPKI